VTRLVEATPGEPAAAVRARLDNAG
jgi:hypothetical protein